jgi:hypothetical protein
MLRLDRFVMGKKMSRLDEQLKMAQCPKAFRIRYGSSGKSLAADSAIACFSSNLFPLSWNAVRAAS